MQAHIINAPPSSPLLMDNIVHFGRILRKTGMPVGTAHILDAVRVVEWVGVEDRQAFYWTLHGVFVKSHEQDILFHQAFELFWKPRGLMEKMINMLSPQAPNMPVEKHEKPGETRVRDAFSANMQQQPPKLEEKIEIDASQSMSPDEVLQSKDFAQMSVEEIREAEQALRSLTLPDDTILTRKFIPAPQGRQLDMRRVMREGLKNQGQFIKLAHKKRKKIKPPIVVLCDISGSMNQYSRIFLHFIHGLMAHRNHVHCFLFGTRLNNVTRALKKRDVDAALMQCASEVKDWAGGTRIGAALADFNRYWSRRVLGGAPTVMLISDGLERDGLEELSPQMARLQLSCRQLIWLNPLLRFERFEAKAGGIKAMLPHVDAFMPIHSLDAVRDLCASLAKNNFR